ncbi:PqqD family protein [Orrella marina]|uniref:Pyrroloquinoline quinone biosynthesis protein PqqD n=1 Tax=Orrella marina TaxID=2163011 RepID=A0A2R4XGX6_9BURK|nr:PqqD family protein [Orrella marina]AWB33066.1 pyrroloquinoline quinone biosynthesis protein PqqD [Orrella marina]
MFENSYQLANPDIVFEQFGDDLVVLNLRSGQYFGFNNVGALVWSALSSGVKASSLIEAGVQPQDLEKFLSSLVSNELLVAQAPLDIQLAQEVRIQLAGASEVPTIEVYDDLADLIMADPIHDVDAETGWPNRPDA